MKPEIAARAQAPRSVDTVAGRDAHDDAPDSAATPLFSLPFFWPLLGAAAAGQAATTFLDKMTSAWAPASEVGLRAPPFEWATANSIRLELPSMRLRDFSGGAGGQATLIWPSGA